MIAVVGLTSAGAYVLARRALGRSHRDLTAAAGNMLECLGVMVAFTAVNLSTGAGVILGMRLITGRFLSMYILDDLAWGVLSALQGLTWWLWWRRSSSTR